MYERFIAALIAAVVSCSTAAGAKLVVDHVRETVEAQQQAFIDILSSDTQSAAAKICEMSDILSNGDIDALINTYLP